jgi:hypothetical protein
VKKLNKISKQSQVSKKDQRDQVVKPVELKMRAAGPAGSRCCTHSARISHRHEDACVARLVADKLTPTKDGDVLVYKADSLVCSTEIDDHNGAEDWCAASK